MKKVKELFKKKITWIVVGILVVSLGLGILLPFSWSKENFSEEEKLMKKLEELGKDFYENLYYEKVGTTEEERKNFVAKFETLGIKINLDNLSRYDTENKETILSEFVNHNTGEACDKEETKVIIKPQTPYEKESYTIETVLVCGFDK